jgi:hypothetical protein
LRSLGRVLLVAVVSLLAALQGPPAAPASAARSDATPSALHVMVTPNHINVGRDVLLHVVVTGPGKQPVAARISVSGVGKLLQGTAAHGTLVVKVHANVLGNATLQATATGFSVTTLRVPIVPGPPVSVAAIVRGMSIQAPNAKVKKGAVGSDLLANYHALTGRAQLASLAARDGTLIDLNSGTDVLIKDPLHTTINGGELFLAVVHGAASHQVQAGTALAATKGTRFDVRYNAKNRSFVITVVEGRVQVTNQRFSRVVSAGQQSTVVASQPPSAPKNVDVRKIVAWVRTLPNTTAAVGPGLVGANTPAATTTATPTEIATEAPTETATETPTATLSTVTATATGTPTASTSPSGTPTSITTPLPLPSLRIAFTPQVSSDPSAVIPGQAVTISGTAFQPFELVLVSIDDVQLVLPSAAADGTFSAQATIPVIESAGTHTVTAVGQTSGIQGSTPLTVVASP